jgi:hypothetical protein
MVTVLFDFDNTLTDLDSDHHVVEVLSPQVFESEMKFDRSRPRKETWPEVMSKWFV